jgi:hypothetical protein
VSLREQRVTRLDDGKWEAPDENDISPETIRNLVAGGIYGRRAH